MSQDTQVCSEVEARVDRIAEPRAALVPHGPPWVAVGRAITANRETLALALAESVADWDKYRAAIEADRSEFLRLEIYAFVDYLARYFETGDENYRHLYVGEKLKQLYEPGVSEEQQGAGRELVTQRDLDGMTRILRGKLPESELLLFQAVMLDIARVVTTSSKQTAKLLMVGDCLHLDVMGFLASASLADGIGLKPTFVTEKNGALVRRSLKELAATPEGAKFDLVLFSPFTYAFSLAYAQLLNGKQAFASRSAIEAIVDETWKDVAATLDLLADLFECPIIVHNSSNILRHNDTFMDRVKHTLTGRTRRLARTLINQRLAAYITAKNAETFEHFFPLDEVAIAQRHGSAGEFQMGRYFYHSQLQHPAYMGKAIAEIYRDLVFVQKRLFTKKLIVCDLDNTLWAGVIGEGAGVSHYLDRQETLKKLRKKGVVLAVNSKNDPNNVKWTGAALSEDDFVNMQINWEPKVGNFRKIKEALNLGYKDYVFLDDRADERAMASGAYPDMSVMDAEDKRTWELLERWAQMLPAQGDGDRTAFYKSRESRNQFLGEKGLTEDDVSAAFDALGIKITIRRAARGDLKRVAELINRTNQFNMQGSRTTLKEIQTWHDDDAWRIYIVDAGDKFGPMGTVSVLICHTTAEHVDIPIFVLSCRVFGYGIETALLNHLKKTAAGKPIIGHLVETPANPPCREVYKKHGFTSEDNKRWTFTGEPAADPSWLTIITE